MSEPMAPPPPPFPPAPAPQKNNTMKWVLGCGLGCLVVAIVAVVAVSALAYFGFKKGAPMAIQSAYGQFKTEGKVPAADQPTYDRVVELGTGSDASMYSAALVGSVVFGTLADGAVSDDERTALNDALAMLEANPSITAQQLQEFQSKHPQYTGAQPGAFGIPAPPTAAEPPEAPAEPEDATPPATEPPAAPPVEAVPPAQ